jgi:Pilin (bacterial filament)
LASTAKAAVGDNAANSKPFAAGYSGVGLATKSVTANPVGGGLVAVGTPATNQTGIHINPLNGEITIAYNVAVQPAGANLLTIVPSQTAPGGGAAVPLATGPTATPLGNEALVPASNIRWDCYAAGVIPRTDVPGLPGPTTTPTLSQKYTPAECR